ncbi:Metal homeostasis factor ATX1 [Vanrija pseudolonga]|uniref:Metal homeostasis factor ATX1 n=1 Tax=Vanrija pseudolonga TaxID=143232 RepID=A0AAF0Y6I1_9TREE|nr:Metal homeostasis factor ATX1 [Vanrija pseudolonga]
MAARDSARGSLTLASQSTGPAYNYTVKMTCGGCSGAIDRVLKKNIEAPNGYTVSLETQKVVVFGPSLPPFDTITEKIAKTGKQIISKEEIAAGAPIPA